MNTRTFFKFANTFLKNRIELKTQTFRIFQNIFRRDEHFLNFWTNFLKHEQFWILKTNLEAPTIFSTTDIFWILRTNFKVSNVSKFEHLSNNANKFWNSKQFFWICEQFLKQEHILKNSEKNLKTWTFFWICEHLFNSQTLICKFALDVSRF